MRLALQKTAELDSVLNAPGWSLMTDDKKDGVIIYSREKNGLTSIKAHGVVEFSPMQIFKTIGDAEHYRKEYDANYE